MKIIITGGHLSPLLSVLEELPKETSVLILGRKQALEGDKGISLELKTLSEKNIPFRAIKTGRLQRKLTGRTFSSLLKFPLGFFQSIAILKKFHPDVVLSFGGYVSLPVTLAAFFLRIPVIIHEQTLGAGLANKITSKFAKKVCISWESSRKFFPKEKTVLTGNPIRQFSREAKSDFAKQISNEKLPLIYITGGSSGSHSINILIEDILEKLLNKYRVIHQVGDAWEFKDYERLGKLNKSLSKELQRRYYLTKFVDPNDVGSILNSADLVISRSGINTITELIYFQKPALLIPLPYSQRGEQIENAKFLQSLGLAEVAFQNNITSEKLYQLVNSMIKNLNQYKEKNKNSLIEKDAAKKIIEICVKES